MVAIPLNAPDPTLEAVYKAIEAAGRDVDAPEDHERDYIGASAIGNACARQIWYDYNKYPKAPFEAETLFNFSDGHRIENVIAKRLRMVQGIDLWTHDVDGKQFERTAFGGKFKAHPDGILLGLLQAPKTHHIWENKAPGQKKYNEFQNCKAKFGEKQALRNWNENYFVQAQILMKLFEMTRHYMTVALAGGREIDSCRTEYQPEVAEKYLDRAGKLLAATQPPAKINEKPDFFVCKMCAHMGHCHK